MQTDSISATEHPDPPNISFPILVRLIWHSRGVGMCRISVQKRQNKGKAEMETLEAHPQIPHAQAVEGAGKLS